MGLKDDLGSITASIETPGSATARPSRQARTAPGNLFAFSEQSRAMEEELEALKRSAGGPRLLKRSSLRASKYQTRVLTQESVEELAANLRENELATPIVVRPTGDGFFEIVAGHRRDAAFGLLNRDDIPAVVVEMSDEQAERAVFFDNFFPPDISDYEKFLGLQQIRTRHGYTHEQLAERSGVSRALVSHLMAFERLPDAGLQMLNVHPRAIGAAVALKLAALAEPFHPRIAPGIELVAQGSLKQTLLPDWVIGKSEPERVEPTVVRAGKAVFAKVQRRERRLTIDFTQAEDAAALEREIATLLKARATASKKK